MLLPFVSPQNFLDPQTDKNGKPYGPVRYKEIAKEKYIISKKTNTSYLEAGLLPAKEREFLLEFISDDLEKEYEAMQDAKRKNSKGRRK